MILIVSPAVNGRDFRAESCRWISIQTVAPLYPKCAISQSMKSQGKISAPVQRQARFNLNFEENFFDILII